jgi:hypothetical protein
VDQPLASSEDEESALIPCQVGEDGDNVVYSFATPAPGPSRENRPDRKQVRILSLSAEG